MGAVSNKDQLIMLKIKSLLNHLEYIIKDEHKPVVEKYHLVCRKYCSWGDNNASA